MHYIYICHHCCKPSYFEPNGKQIPGVSFGNSLEDIPSEIHNLYEEARNCISVNSFTGFGALLQKTLDEYCSFQGSGKNLRFAEYVDHLANEGYVPPDGRDWVDHIRKKGNGATHEIAIMTKQDAEDLVKFAESLLRFIYEYRAIMLKRKPPTA